MSSNMKSIVFAAVLCVVCSVLLTAASTGLKEQQERNNTLDRQTNLLKSVRLVSGDKVYTPLEIDKLYKDSIRMVYVDSEGNVYSKDNAPEKAMPLYIELDKSKNGESVSSYILPIETKGLWGTIYGYLAVKTDGETINGFTVYKSAETPGLGGEIEKQWFQNNFVGKKIVNAEGHFASIAVAKGQVKDLPDKVRPNLVDGISGATLTGKKLSEGLKRILTDYEPLAEKLRKKEPVEFLKNGKTS